MTATDDRTSASTEIKFHVLGAVQAIRHGEPLNIGGPKQRTVLALLIAELGRAVSTDRLIDATWGDKPLAGDRRRSLQTYVSNLRRVLDGAIVRESGGYRLDVDRSDVDATWFEDEVAAAEALADNPESAADQLRRALAAWRGSPYADMDGRTELEAEIARLNELRQLALEARIDADLEAGNHRQVVVEMEALTEEHPLRERLRGQQMVALFRCGRQAEALRAYQKARTHLAEELGIDPSPELREIEQGILDQDEALLGDTAGSIVRRAILIADIDGKGGLAELGPTDRQHVIDATAPRSTPLSPPQPVRSLPCADRRHMPPSTQRSMPSQLRRPPSGPSVDRENAVQVFGWPSTLAMLNLELTAKSPDRRCHAAADWLPLLGVDRCCSQPKPKRTSARAAKPAGRSRHLVCIQFRASGRR